MSAVKTRTFALNASASSALRTMGKHGANTMNVQFMVDDWTAAACYLQFSDDGTTWGFVVDGDNDIFGILTADMVADRWHTLIGVPAVHKYMRFVSAQDGGAVLTNQAALRTVQVHIDYT